MITLPPSLPSFSLSNLLLGSLFLILAYLFNNKFASYLSSLISFKNPSPSIAKHIKYISTGIALVILSDTFPLPPPPNNSYLIQLLHWPLLFTGFLILAIHSLKLNHHVFSILQKNPHNYPIRSFIPLIRNSIQLLILTTITIAIIHALGYQAGPLLTTLGIGGAALALASKETISNFFGSISILLDKPFKIGDKIKIASNIEGKVISIGVRSTQIQNDHNTLITIPNNSLANEIIFNLSSSHQNLINLSIHIHPHTPPHSIPPLLSSLHQSISSSPYILNDNIQVYLHSISPSSILISVSCFSSSNNLDQTKQSLLLNLLQLIHSHNIQLPPIPPL